ncbi:MAG: hypothetical protein K0R12_1013 [Gammaproteobacteria bacterium]|jgi:hypothetical protein|nr:hypothetical protein [Gammaproteobacteria bacterium]
MPPHKPNLFLEDYNHKLAEFEKKVDFFSSQVDNLEKFADVAAARTVLDLIATYAYIAYLNIFYINASYPLRQKTVPPPSKEDLIIGQRKLKK